MKREHHPHPFASRGPNTLPLDCWPWDAWEYSHDRERIEEGYREELEDQAHRERKERE
jgi:hypothetical protein